MTKNKTSTPNSPNKSRIQLLCERYGIPYPYEQSENGKTSIHFIIKPKSEIKEE
jgi:hypothetical protein